MAASPAPATIAGVNQQIAKLTNQIKVLEQRFDVLANRFCIYHLADRNKPAAFGIILRKQLNKDLKEELADIYIITEHLGSAQIVFDKRPVSADPEVPRGHRYEPLVLPPELFSEQIADLLDLGKEQPSSDGNSALS